MRRTGWVVLALVAIMAAAGCEEELTASPDAPAAGSAGPSQPSETLEPLVPTDDAQPAPDQPRDPAASRPPADPPGAGGPATGGVPEPYLDAVLADAARRAGVGAGQVRVERAQPAQWPDGSLGCPEPGMQYIQMIVDGYWVELTAGGRAFDYRLDGQGNYRLCERPDRSPPYTTDR